MPTAEYNGYDADHVDAMAHAAFDAMKRVSIPDMTTPTEVLCAAFVLLDWTLRRVNEIQAPEDRAANAKEIARVLNEFMVDYGQVPN